MNCTTTTCLGLVAAMALSAWAQSSPDTFLLIDGTYVAEVRKRAAPGGGQDAVVAAAVAALEGDAKKALAITPPSVMDKSIVPPSGDKHDYMSQAPYWWRLTESPYGRDEGKNGNNHETWYDVQVAGLALYTGQEDVARRTLEGSRERIACQFEPDGRQPRELERTRAWDYSEFNLRAFFDLAVLGQRVGVDLWTYQTADGRSLKRALDFMVPFATGAQKWPYEQITGFRPQIIHGLLRRAAVGMNEPKYRALAATIGGGSARLALVVP